MVFSLRTRRRAAVFAGSVLLATGLPFTLSACGSSEPPARQQAGDPAPVSLMFGSSLTEALEDQVTAQDAAVQKAAAMEQARVKAQKAAEREAAPAPERAPESEQAGSVTDGRGTCTTDPADRAACRNPSGTINPDGGDVDGDGVFEQNEPVGPGYKDPRAYDGGKTSGETQCEWLRSQGIAC